MIIENFPKNSNQAYLFAKNKTPVLNVIFLEAPFSECLDNEEKKPESEKRSSILLHNIFTK